MDANYKSLLETKQELEELLIRFRKNLVKASSTSKGDIDIEISNIVHKLNDVQAEINEYEFNNITRFNASNIQKIDSKNEEEIGKNRIERQINMGKKSTYIEKQNVFNREQTTSEPIIKKVQIMEDDKLTQPPEGIWGFLKSLFNAIPYPLNSLVALCLLAGASYLVYNHFMQTKKTQPIVTSEKVYISGRIYINNGSPALNEVKRLVLKNLSEINSAHLDATGKFTFDNVLVPKNNKLLVNITFSDDITVPTEELSVGKVNTEDNTIYLPDIYAERPKPAKIGKQATSWSIKIINQVHNGTGENKAK
jgi:hypothetical protein